MDMLMPAAFNLVLSDWRAGSTSLVSSLQNSGQPQIMKATYFLPAFLFFNDFCGRENENFKTPNLSYRYNRIEEFREAARRSGQRGNLFMLYRSPEDEELSLMLKVYSIHYRRSNGIADPDPKVLTEFYRTWQIVRSLCIRQDFPLQAFEFFFGDSCSVSCHGSSIILENRIARMIYAPIDRNIEGALRLFLDDAGFILTHENQMRSVSPDLVDFARTQFSTHG
jgi:hypothetical protein